MSGELEGSILAGESLVNGRECVELSLNVDLVLGVKVAVGDRQM